LEYRDDELRPSQLLEGEELNKERLDTLRDSLDDLKIIDVERKPKGMGADLKADKGFMNDREAMASLIQRGFYPVPVEDDKIDLWSSDGELLIDTKDGVQYVMRFGGIAGVETGDDEKGEQQSQLNRYLFVTARVNDAQFPMPDLEPLPEGATNAKPDAGAAAPAGEAAKEPASKASDGAATDANAEPAQEAAGGETSPETTPAKTDPPPADSAGQAAVDQPAATDPGQSQAADEGAKTAAGTPSSGTDLDEEVSRISKENQRKLDERQDKIDKARKKVGELNYRFADWYYVISEDVFKKIHLGRADVIRLSEKAKKEGPSLEAFRNLETQGLNPPAAEEPPSDENSADTP
jgi:hypothetical protein